LYCINFLEKNIEWLRINLEKHKGKYFIFDTPGQIEIFTLSDSFKAILSFITNEKKGMGIRLCAVNLIESNNLLDLPKYIFSILSVLNSMIMLELPQVNIISKADLLKEFGELPFDLGFYKNPADDEKIKFYLDEANLNPKFKALNKRISEFVIEHGLVGFSILDVKNQKLLNKIMSQIDSASGYIYSDSGPQKEEKYVEIRNVIAKQDIAFDDDDEYN
jgi:hypothetical protein